MRIEEVPPVEKTYTITLTENELRLLGIVFGLTIPNDLKRAIENDNLIRAKYDQRFVLGGYDDILETLGIT
jgi:hypothetical protein